MTVSDLRRHQRRNGVGIILIVLALVAAMAGCPPGSRPDPDPPPSPPPDPGPSLDLEIRTWYDMDAVRDNLAGHHRLMNSLNATTAGYEELAGPRANDGAGWEPIGSLAPGYYLPFIGTFDGQGYEISDLFIARPDEEYVGLFGGISSFGTDGGGIVYNLGVVNAVVAGREAVGGLVGFNDGTISNSFFEGSVTGHRHSVGGLAGANTGTVSNCHFEGSVVCTESSATGFGAAGGLVGSNGRGTVSRSSSTGSVTGGKRVGGLVGYDWRGSISDSHSRCDVTGNDDVGGLVGENGGTVSNSYSTGTVTGKWYVGGLVGYNESWGRVVNCYSTGNVTGELAIGGLVGASESGTTVSKSFWDTDTSVMEKSDGGTGKTTAQMQDIGTFVGAGWSIVAVAANVTDPAYTWNIVDGQAYPFLSWQSAQYSA